MDEHRPSKSADAGSNPVVRTTSWRQTFKLLGQLCLIGIPATVLHVVLWGWYLGWPEEPGPILVVGLALMNYCILQLCFGLVLWWNNERP